MPYIDTKYLGKCETCRHHSNSGCDTYCDHGEEYSPNLSKIPTADVVEVKHGEWIEVDDGIDIGSGKHLECSICEKWKKDRIKSNCCPNCGAKMEGGM